MVGVGWESLHGLKIICTPAWHWHIVQDRARWKRAALRAGPARAPVGDGRRAGAPAAPGSSLALQKRRPLAQNL